MIITIMKMDIPAETMRMDTPAAVMKTDIPAEAVAEDVVPSHLLPVSYTHLNSEGKALRNERGRDPFVV